MGEWICPKCGVNVDKLEEEGEDFNMALTKAGIVKVTDIEEFGHDHYYIEAVVSINGTDEVVTMVSDGGAIESLRIESIGNVKYSHKELGAYLSGVADMYLLGTNGRGLPTARHLSSEEVALYLSKNVPSKYASEIDKVVAFSRREGLYYECLQDIAYELSIGTSFEEPTRGLTPLDVEEEL